MRARPVVSEQGKGGVWLVIAMKQDMEKVEQGN